MDKKNIVKNALQGGTGKEDPNKQVSLSKVHAGDESELLKFVMIVKPGYVKSFMEEKGFSLKSKEDFLYLPKIMKLGLDKKGLTNGEGKVVVFDLKKYLEDAPMDKEEIKGSGIIFIR